MNNQNTRMSQSLPSTNPPPTITGIVQTQFLLVFGQAGVEVNLTIAWEQRTSAVSHRVSVSPGRTNLIMRNGINGCVTHGVEDKQGYWIRPRRKQKKHPSQRIPDKNSWSSWSAPNSLSITVVSLAVPLLKFRVVLWKCKKFSTQVMSTRQRHRTLISKVGAMVYDSNELWVKVGDFFANFPNAQMEDRNKHCRDKSHLII